MQSEPTEVEPDAEDSALPAAAETSAGQRVFPTVTAAPGSVQVPGAETAGVTAQPSVVGALDPSMGLLVAQMALLGQSNAVPTPELIGQWRTSLQDLVARGTSGIPAIQSFLAQKKDASFNRAISLELGYGSARLGVLEALRGIGGPEATALMATTLEETTAPREVALLAHNLEEAAPGQYLQRAIDISLSQLAASVSDSRNELDVAPLFEVFREYGGAAVVADLEKAVGQWKYYAMSTLAGLPEDAGIPSLLRMADASVRGGDRLEALEMIAQLASSNDAARELLVSQVSNKEIPANFWPYLSSPLAGSQYYPVDTVLTKYPSVQGWSDVQSTHINVGNQNVYSLTSDAAQTPEGIDRQLALVDQLLGVASDATAVQSLQRARQMLQNRLGRAVAQQAPVPPGGP